jgi:hypothetical protein
MCLMIACCSPSGTLPRCACFLLAPVGMLTPEGQITVTEAVLISHCPYCATQASTPLPCLPVTHMDETLGTLGYASRTKNITNKPAVQVCVCVCV